MPPKKVAAPTKKAVAPAEHPAYKDMIKEAVLQLKERNGSSRQALKKYIQNNFKIKASNFETQFNAALKRGVQSGEFVQPKGPSGTVKLQKKEAKTTAEKKPVKKAAAVKPKKAAPAPKKEKKEVAPKKEKKPVAKPKAAKPAPAKTTKATKPKATKPKAAGVTKTKAATKAKAASTRPSPKRKSAKAA
ncbi:putative histone h1 [Lipomyces tetrasporus]|uniref:Histone H1 n=1 Tax=Lipomyces tetrasporus TaxID=54092 RepID=A0AAD7QS78_9ASCO|nr:putative histone h1 [Lipomyces tetrasporus]KAJ8100475.1 putative histone h1 [Lipomyces tetrasporus]